MTSISISRRQLLTVTGLFLFPWDYAAAESLDSEILREVNANRKMHRLSPLTLDQRLTSAADFFSKQLMQKNELDLQGSTGSELHDRLTHVGFAYHFAVENIASGPATSKETVTLWMQSEHHRRNILHPNTTHAGAARAEHPDALALHGFQYYWTLIMAKPA